MSGSFQFCIAFYKLFEQQSMKYWNKVYSSFTLLYSLHSFAYVTFLYFPSSKEYPNLIFFFLFPFTLAFSLNLKFSLLCCFAQVFFFLHKACDRHMFCRPPEVKSEWSFILPRKISFQLVSKLVEWSPGGPLCLQEPFQWSGCPFTGQELPTRGVMDTVFRGTRRAQNKGGSGTSGAQKNRTWVPWAQWNRRVKGIRGAEQQDCKTGHSTTGGSGAPEGHRATGGSGTSGAQKNRTQVQGAQWNRRVKGISGAEQQEMSGLRCEKGFSSLKKQRVRATDQEEGQGRLGHRKTVGQGHRGNRTTRGSGALRHSALGRVRGSSGAEQQDCQTAQRSKKVRGPGAQYNRRVRGTMCTVKQKGFRESAAPGQREAGRLVAHTTEPACRGSMQRWHQGL